MDYFSIHDDLAGSHGFYHVPVDGAFVDSAALLVCEAYCQMDCLSHFFVEQYVGRNVAIAVQINRPIVRLVTEYLENKGINAHLILITNNKDLKSTKELDDYKENEWQAIVQDFRDIITKIQTEVGNAEFHFFFAAPAALTTALGVIFGNFWNAHIYNWVKGENTYSKVLKLPIRL